ncbi:MAG TPA: ferrous iron transport protein A [Gammaproteobacteria bacterium]|nr:ferrous iron transport protein A [Gammaproteobacteria bacterium]
MTSAQSVSLSDLPTGFRGIVARVNGGRDLDARLAAMGLTAGTEIVVLQNRGFGPMLAKVRDTRIALGRGQAGMVTVYECEPADPRTATRLAAPG